MRPSLFRMALTAWLAAPLAAQNSDLGFLFGASPQKTEIRQNSINTSAQGSLQINYAWQLREGPAGRLYVEMPIVFVGGSSSQIGPGITGRSGASAFYIPGLRYQHNLTPRVAVYGAAGVGVQVRHTQLGLVSGRTVVSSNETRASLAGDVGAGLDFRLSRVWSLRGEIRDFVGSKQFLGQRNSVNIQFGFALHF